MHLLSNVCVGCLAQWLVLRLVCGADVVRLVRQANLAASVGARKANIADIGAWARPWQVEGNRQRCRPVCGGHGDSAEFDGAAVHVCVFGLRTPSSS